MVKTNQILEQGLKLKFFPPILKNDLKVVKPNVKELDMESAKWQKALIGYVIEGAPTFKEMLKFFYGEWNSIKVPKVLLRDNRYFVSKFDSLEDKGQIMEIGPYTFNNRSFVLKD